MGWRPFSIGWGCLKRGEAPPMAQMREPRRGADTETGAAWEAGSTTGGMGAPLLEVGGVTKWFATGRGRPVTALEDVSLCVQANELVALVGPSGSGKSTLLSIVAGLEAPTTGTVALRGDAMVRRLGRIAYMPQRDLLL